MPYTDISNPTKVMGNTSKIEAARLPKSTPGLPKSRRRGAKMKENSKRCQKIAKSVTKGHLGRAKGELQRLRLLT